MGFFSSLLFLCRFEETCCGGTSRVDVVRKRESVSLLKSLTSEDDTLTKILVVVFI